MIAGELELLMFANMARLSNDMAQARRISGEAMNKIEQAAGGARRALEAVGLGFSVASVAGMVKGAIDANDHLTDLYKTTKLLPSTLSGLDLAAQQSGTTLEGAANAVSKLAENMGKDSLKFQQVGISAKDPVEAFKQLADIFNSIENPQQRMAFGAAALGKSWKEVAPLLAAGGDEIGRMVEQGTALAGNIDEIAAASDAFNDKLVVLHATMKGGFNKVVYDMLPILDKLVDYLQQSAQGATGVTDQFNPLVEVVRVLVVMGANVVYVFKSIGIELGGISAQIAALASGDFEGFSAIGKAMKEDAAAARKEIDAFSESVMQASNKAAKAANDSVASGKHADASAIQKFINQGKDGGADGMAIIRGLTTDYANQLAKLNREFNAPMMSAADKQYLDNLAVVTERAARAEEQIGKLKISETERAALLAKVDSAEQAQIANLQKLKKQIEANNASWEHGAKVALRGYLNEIENVAKQSEHLFSSAFKGMEDALVSFVQTGKLDFKSLTDSIIADMIRMSVQQNMTGPLFRYAAGLFGTGSMSTPNAAGSGGFMNNSAGETLSFAGGGFTGSGPRSGGLDGMGGFVAIMHPNETVIDHTKEKTTSRSLVLNYAPVFQIDARSDQAQVEQIANRAVRKGNAEFIDRLQRQGVI